MKTKITILLLLIAQIPLISTFAQDHLHIKKAYDAYGKQKGSVYVQLSSDILSQGSRITSYKSLVTDESAEKIETIRNAVNADIEKGSKISELNKDGRIESGVYVLSQKKLDGSYEYILYKNKSKKITLLYLKGNFPPRDLDDELSKLKDLFIIVNNKRLKLN